MIPAAKPVDEEKRLAALKRYGVLDSLPETVYDDITLLASRICGTPIALISLVDTERQWFKSRVGLDVHETPRAVAFCAHAILDPSELLVVGDTMLDTRFSDNPLVVSDPSIRFYAGASIVTDDGFALGTVCAIDRRPRQLDDGQLASLRSLARLVSTLLEHRRLAQLEAKRAIEENHRELEYLLALNAQGVDLKSFADLDYTYQYANQTFLDYWALPLERVKGRPMAEIFGQERFEREIKPLADRVFAGETLRYKTAIDYPGRGRRHVDAVSHPIYDKNGKVMGAVLRTHDITDLREREEQLAATVTRLEGKTLAQQRFIHILSHDLREPINSIVNFGTLLEKSYASKLPPDGRDFLARVLGGGTRMKALLDDLLELVRLDHLQLTLAPVDLNALLAEVRLDLADAMLRTGATIAVANLPVVSGERHLLRVLFQNLVANALKFARRGVAPHVDVTAIEAAGEWEIRLADNGIGIPQDQLENVFEMFRRLHPRKEYEGTGLGLATCRRIAEMHAGRVWATSESRRGACVHVALPVKRPQNPQGDQS